VSGNDKILQATKYHVEHRTFYVCIIVGCVVSTLLAHPPYIPTPKQCIASHDNDACATKTNTAEKADNGLRVIVGMVDSAIRGIGPNT